MRIIGGRLGGRRIQAPRGATTRPTADRVREAMFNILGPPDADVRVLDVFCGAGALGLEALSRGASQACFIDDARPALACVRKNIQALGLDERCQVLHGDAPQVLGRLAAGAATSGQGLFAWVFVDPPYRSDLAGRALAALAGGDLLAPGAVVVVEHDRRNPPDPVHGCLVRTDQRRYGDTLVSFYQPHAPDAPALSLTPQRPPT